MSSLEQEIFLQWGNKKRLRCLRAKDQKISRRRKNSSRFLCQEGTTLRSGLPDRRRTSPEKEERYYYTTRGHVVDKIGKAYLEVNNGEDSKKKEESKWPKVFITLSSKEKEEDFMAMKGCKPSHRPKKRSKLIQKTILLVSPGTWLADLCPDRYDVRVKKSSKKRGGRGLKAMGNMETTDSD